MAQQIAIYAHFHYNSNFDTLLINAAIIVAPGIFLLKFQHNFLI